MTLELCFELANDTLHSSGLHPCNLGTCGSAAAAVLLGECPSLSVTLSQLESLVLVSRAEHGRAIVGHVLPGPTYGVRSILTMLVSIFMGGRIKVANDKGAMARYPMLTLLCAMTQARDRSAFSLFVWIMLPFSFFRSFIFFGQLNGACIMESGLLRYMSDTHLRFGPLIYLGICSVPSPLQRRLTLTAGRRGSQAIITSRKTICS